MLRLTYVALAAILAVALSGADRSSFSDLGTSLPSAVSSATSTTSSGSGGGGSSGGGGGGGGGGGW